MEGSGLDLTDVVHAQIPRERKRGSIRIKVSINVYLINVLSKVLWTCTRFSHDDQSLGVGSSAQREVRGLGREVGGQEGGEGDVEEKFSPMNHCWAAVISSSSQ